MDSSLSVEESKGVGLRGLGRVVSVQNMFCWGKHTAWDDTCSGSEGLDDCAIQFKLDCSLVKAVVYE